MKKIFLLLSIFLTMLFPCFTESSITIKKIDEENKVVKFGKKVDGFKDVIVIDAKKSQRNQLASVSLAEYADHDVYIEFSCDIKIVDKTGAENDIVWLVNDLKAGFPELYHGKIPSGEWKKISGKKFINLGAKKSFYISPMGIEKENVTIYLKNFKLKISGENIGEDVIPQTFWLEEESLAKAYEPYFDYFGLTVPLNGMLDNEEVQKGLKHQASCFTMENEFKPDFLFAWVTPGGLTDFIAEDGKVYKMPSNTPVFSNMNAILSIAKKNNLKMRGHVLVWHSQTPEWFFHEDFNTKNPFVSSSEMNARLEWYIKSVLENVKKWENENNNGEHIILAWDVVNEACSDNAGPSQFLRTESNWYKVYGDVTFIVNAFRYANKYAPKDVKLVYNDYNCYSVPKTQAIVKVVKAIKAVPDARIDCVGMQSHISMDYPSLQGPGSFEDAIKSFTNLGVDVQITELDMGCGSLHYNSQAMSDRYNQLFTILLDNRKVDGKNGVCGVTMWGTVDERSWIYNHKDGGNEHQHPLLFNGKYTCKPAFYGVLNAAKDYKGDKENE